MEQGSSSAPRTGREKKDWKQPKLQKVQGLDLPAQKPQGAPIKISTSLGVRQVANDAILLVGGQVGAGEALEAVDQLRHDRGLSVKRDGSVLFARSRMRSSHGMSVAHRMLLEAAVQISNEGW